MSLAADQTGAPQSSGASSTLSAEAAEFVPGGHAPQGRAGQGQGGERAGRGRALEEVPRYITTCYPFVNPALTHRTKAGGEGSGVPVAAAATRGFVTNSPYGGAVRQTPAQPMGVGPPFPQQMGYPHPHPHPLPPAAHPWLQSAPSFPPTLSLSPLTPGVHIPFDGGTGGGRGLLPTPSKGDGLLPTPSRYPPAPIPTPSLAMAPHPPSLLLQYPAPPTHPLYVSAEAAGLPLVVGGGPAGGRGGGANVSRGTQKERPPMHPGGRHTLIMKDNSVQTDFNADFADLTLQERASVLYRRGGRRHRAVGAQAATASTDSEGVDSDSGYSSPLHRRNLVSNGTHPARLSQAHQGDPAPRPKHAPPTEPGQGQPGTTPAAGLMASTREGTLHSSNVSRLQSTGVISGKTLGSSVPKETASSSAPSVWGRGVTHHSPHSQEHRDSQPPSLAGSETPGAKNAALTRERSRTPVGVKDAPVPLESGGSKKGHSGVGSLAGSNPSSVGCSGGGGGGGGVSGSLTPSSRAWHSAGSKEVAGGNHAGDVGSSSPAPSRGAWPGPGANPGGTLAGSNPGGVGEGGVSAGGSSSNNQTSSRAWHSASKPGSAGSGGSVGGGGVSSGGPPDVPFNTSRQRKQSPGAVRRGGGGGGGEGGGPSTTTPSLDFPILKPARRNEPPWSLTPSLARGREGGASGGFMGMLADSVKSYASIVKSLSTTGPPAPSGDPPAAAPTSPADPSSGPLGSEGGGGELITTVARGGGVVAGNGRGDFSPSGSGSSGVGVGSAHASHGGVGGSSIPAAAAGVWGGGGGGRKAAWGGAGRGGGAAASSSPVAQSDHKTSGGGGRGLDGPSASSRGADSGTQRAWGGGERASNPSSSGGGAWGGMGSTAAAQRTDSQTKKLVVGGEEEPITISRLKQQQQQHCDTTTTTSHNQQGAWQQQQQQQHHHHQPPSHHGPRTPATSLDRRGKSSDRTRPASDAAGGRQEGGGGRGADSKDGDHPQSEAGRRERSSSAGRPNQQQQQHPLTGPSGDERTDDEGRKKPRRRRHRRRRRKTREGEGEGGVSDGAASGMERTVSSSNISRTSDVTLHFQDDFEFPEVGAVSGGEGGAPSLGGSACVGMPAGVWSPVPPAPPPEEEGDYGGGGGLRRVDSASLLSYSDMLRRKPSVNDVRSRTQSAPGSCLSGEEGGDEKFNSQPGEGSLAPLSKRARKRRKRRELANRAAEAELAEISLEQQMLRELGHKVTGRGSRPSSGSREEKSRSREEKSPARGLMTEGGAGKPSKGGGGGGAGGKRLHQPFDLNIADMLDAFEKKKMVEQKTLVVFKKATLTSLVPREADGRSSSNALDASAPTKRGKERETPKLKKPSPLKKVILKEREEKKRMRLIGDCDVYTDDIGDEADPDAEADPNAEDSEADLIEDPNTGNPVGLGESDLSQDALSCRSADTDPGVSPGADLSPISQTSPLSMSPLTPSASPLNSPIAGYLSRDPVVLRIHSRRFREYCTQILDKDIDTCCTSLLHELVRFQDRMYHKDPNKAKGKRRVVLGLREVTKHLKLKKIKCVVISPNLEKIQSKGGLDEALNNILNMCQDQNVPFVFALGRRALGRACAKLVPVSVAGIFNYEGCEEKFNQLISLTHKGREAYSDMVGAVEREMAENPPPPSLSGASSLPSLYAHMGHSRTPSGCSAISFTSSVLSEPISENYPHAEPETDSKGYEIVRDRHGKVVLPPPPSSAVLAAVAVGAYPSGIGTLGAYAAPIDDFDDGNEADTEDIIDFPRLPKKRVVAVGGGGGGGSGGDVVGVRRAPEEEEGERLEEGRGGRKSGGADSNSVVNLPVVEKSPGLNSDSKSPASPASSLPSAIAAPVSAQDGRGDAQADGSGNSSNNTTNNTNNAGSSSSHRPLSPHHPSTPSPLLLPSPDTTTAAAVRTIDTEEHDTNNAAKNTNTEDADCHSLEEREEEADEGEEEDPEESSHRQQQQQHHQQQQRQLLPHIDSIHSGASSAYDLLVSAEVVSQHSSSRGGGGGGGALDSLSQHSSRTLGDGSLTPNNLEMGAPTLGGESGGGRSGRGGSSSTSASSRLMSKDRVQSWVESCLQEEEDETALSSSHEQSEEEEEEEGEGHD